MVAWGAGVNAVGVPVKTMSTERWVIYGKVCSEGDFRRTISGLMQNGMKILFIQPILLMFDLATTKISVLLFYRRIFITKRFTLVANILLAVVTMWGIASILVSIFDCITTSCYM